jgi:hypothetical protein
MRPLSCVETLVLLSTLACAQAPAVGDYTKLATQATTSCGTSSFTLAKRWENCASTMPREGGLAI